MTCFIKAIFCVALPLYLTFLVGIGLSEEQNSVDQKSTLKSDEGKTDLTQDGKVQRKVPPLSEFETNIKLILANKLNDSSDGNNTNITSSSTTVPPVTTELPQCVQKNTAEQEHDYSLMIFFILLVIIVCILCVHLIIQTKFHYVPESICIVLIGAFIGLMFHVFEFGNWKNEETFSPTIFFIVLLPPIIFESGYNLHKGNFFQNIGSILVFAVFGTVLSAVTVAGGIYLLGKAGVAYKLNLIESFAFGSLISAVDPVATLAIFQAIDVDPILYMLVFGESVLNDAVSIVLTNTVLEFQDPSTAIMSGASIFFHAVGRFCLMFFGSAAIGVCFALISAVILKHIDLHKTPSLEFGFMFIFSYLPYGLAEGLHLSGIMAILFAGIVMSHYTHHNLSPVTQITIQQTFRTVAFIAETSVFAYQGLAIFSFKHERDNIFPLSFVVNFFREHKITRKNQFIMWFSGLRGAIAFALSLHLDFVEPVKSVLVTTTLIIVLFTILCLGGATMPLMKVLNANTSNKKKKKRSKKKREINFSKTKELGETVDSEHLSELTEEEYEMNLVKQNQKGFLKFDAKYLVPFFTRRFTQQQVREGRNHMDNLTKQWYQDVRAAPSESESEENDDDQTKALMTTTVIG